MIDYRAFEKTLHNLMLQWRNYQDNRDHHRNLTALDREALAESCIQRFELCYDCLWKVLKRYLIEEMGLADVPNSPKPLFRLAYACKVLTSPIETWLGYATMRTDTVHDYDGQKAQQCLAQLQSFIDDAATLYRTMTGQLDPCPQQLEVAPQHLTLLRQIIRAYIPHAVVWVFGSRIKGTSRPESDLDLVVHSTFEERSHVDEFKEALDESDFPFRVDVLVWDAVSDTFREHIQQNYIVL